MLLHIQMFSWQMVRVWGTDPAAARHSTLTLAAARRPTAGHRQKGLGSQIVPNKATASAAAPGAAAQPSGCSLGRLGAGEGLRWPRDAELLLAAP